MKMNTDSQRETLFIILYFNMVFRADLFGSPKLVLLPLSDGESVEWDYLHGGFLHGIPTRLPSGPNNAIIITIRSRCF